ncbi:hypothetical protein QYZ87_04860 [Porphyromonadaceae bacterium W3.11]|nr:hypothetical protein [Porphyromonadaceae bacterium W3.11]
MTRDEFLRVFDDGDCKSNAMKQVIDWVRVLPKYAKIRIDKDFTSGELSFTRVDRKRRKKKSKN